MFVRIRSACADFCCAAVDLQDFDVPPEATWDNAMRLIINDPRYGALKAIGEKKATFNEYCTVSSPDRRLAHCSHSLCDCLCVQHRKRLFQDTHLPCCLSLALHKA
jgi:hypothetical protein